MRLLLLLPLLMLVGCSTEEKPVYLYCLNEDWGKFGDSWLIIDKANGLWISSTEDPLNRPEDHNIFTAKLFEDETYYRPLNEFGNVRTDIEFDRRTLELKNYGDFNVIRACEIIDPLPEFRAEGMEQELPKI